ncbi:hypothetical protein WME73_49725 [Sorangium sp. So ce302]|uniref:hypothetical protein n=1 Tax=Sorangium sp. So ce302 TaxID=3133297 RepID=UPI003F63BA60
MKTPGFMPGIAGILGTGAVRAIAVFPGYPLNADRRTHANQASAAARQQNNECVLWGTDAAASAPNVSVAAWTLP